MKNLVIAAHPDDEVLGCGGSIHKFSSKESSVVYIVSKGRSDKLDQRFDTLSLRTFIEAIESRIKRDKPDRIFTHHLDDMNKDHRIIAEATLVATRGLNIEVLGYEIFSASGSFDFKPDTYIELTREDVMHKISEMNRLYAHEMREYPHARSEEGIIILAKYRGMQYSLKYAEAFKTLRRVL